jgi:hypothetical protein
MPHIISATAIERGQQLAMCGHVFESYRAAVDAGHAVGNYTPTMTAMSAYHARGIECEACIVRHAQSTHAGDIAQADDIDRNNGARRLEETIRRHEEALSILRRELTACEEGEPFTHYPDLPTDR